MSAIIIAAICLVLVFFCIFPRLKNPLWSNSPKVENFSFDYS
ncbi:MAG: DUF3488 domain-containing protein [Firmicutes bacterium]|nr:DUF3488 domain-containing protein [Bacillota bacterium]